MDYFKWKEKGVLVLPALHRHLAVAALCSSPLFGNASDENSIWAGRNGDSLTPRAFVCLEVCFLVFLRQTRLSDLANCFQFSFFQVLPLWEGSVTSSIKPSLFRRPRLLQIYSISTVNTCSKTSFQGSLMHSPPSCLSSEVGTLCHHQLLVRDTSVSQLREITYNIFLASPTNLNLQTAMISASFLDCSRHHTWDYPCRPFQELISWACPKDKWKIWVRLPFISGSAVPSQKAALPPASLYLPAA